MKSINFFILTAFFLLELGAIASFSYWAYHLYTGTAVKIILAIIAPLVIATIWGVFLSPKASLPIFPFPLRTTLKLVVFVFASVALYATGKSGLGVTFLIISVLIVMTVFILNLHEVKM
ncbi:YrdB family protein [Robertmurraya kyonggiensis]|uniref:DUF2568 domain-containing protein n=1 Tax=Robertmurraya kyonggiensis TaxID=1037680 RepID=A0A4U1D372_9BACI|nr:YrdB family protein [Robertmurraya kyonggiensis]TKC16839.1 DUF2568 domain-containing protein [Robertmurraya kyonggiensis]